jgi:hypothetical protein
MMVSSLLCPLCPPIMRFVRAQNLFSALDKTSVFARFLALYKSARLCYSMLTAYPSGPRTGDRGSYLYPTTLFFAARTRAALFFAFFSLSLKMTVASGRALRYNK